MFQFTLISPYIISTVGFIFSSSISALYSSSPIIMKSNIFRVFIVLICVIYSNAVISFADVFNQREFEPVLLNKRQPSGLRSSSGLPVKDGCQMPLNETGRKVKVKCENGQTSCNVSSVAAGAYVPSLTFVSVSCDSGYVIDDVKYEQGVCAKGTWFPPTPSCKKLCPNLIGEDLKFECEYAGEKMDCNGPMKPKTRVFAECVYPYVKAYPVNYRYIYCEDNGEWDQMVFKCTSDCGKPYVRTELLISGGLNTTIGEFPWNVAIYDHAQEHHEQLICAGTIVTPYLVISAAHCFYNELTRSTRNASNFEIAVSKYTRPYNAKDIEYQKFYKIKNIHIRTSYIRSGSVLQSDIVILETSTKIEFSAIVRPACFRWNVQHGDNDLITGTLGKVAGWGAIESGLLSDHLLVANLPYISRNDCIRKTPEEFKIIMQLDKFCAGDETDTGPLIERGDAGGGFVVPKNGVYFLYGIVSSRHTALKKFSVFTDVYRHIGWIIQVKNTVEERLILETTKISGKTR